MDVKQINPNGNKSDKYSVNLYKYLKRNPMYVKVYYQAMHSVKVGCDENHDDIKEYQQLDFNINDFDIDDIYLSSNPQCYIEEDGCLVGKRLIGILRGGKGMYENFAYCNHLPRKYIDITELFWSEYIKIGRCIWDKKHDGWLKDSENRFTYIDETHRKCNWCGSIQYREDKTQTIVKTYQTWVNNNTK